MNEIVFGLFVGAFLVNLALFAKTRYMKPSYRFSCPDCQEKGETFVVRADSRLKLLAHRVNHYQANHPLER